MSKTEQRVCLGSESHETKRLINRDTVEVRAHFSARPSDTQQMCEPIGSLVCVASTHRVLAVKVSWRLAVIYPPTVHGRQKPTANHKLRQDFPAHGADW